MRDDHSDANNPNSIGDALLRRVLSDPGTGLPSVRYFRLIREWEERQAARQDSHVRTVRIDVRGGEERLRRSLAWRLCGEFRTSDLIASDGASRYLLLLTRRDAEQTEAVLERIRGFVLTLNEQHPEADPLVVETTIEPEHVSRRREACEAPDVSRLETPTEVPKYEDPKE